MREGLTEGGVIGDERLGKGIAELGDIVKLIASVFLLTHRIDLVLAGESHLVSSRIIGPSAGFLAGMSLQSEIEGIGVIGKEGDADILALLSGELEKALGNEKRLVPARRTLTEAIPSIMSIPRTPSLPRITPSRSQSGMPPSEGTF